MATQSAAVPRWTYDEFARLPDDGNRYEILDGELCVTPSPRPVHQDVVGALAERLRPFARRNDLGRVYPGPVDVLFREGDYLVPDLVFVRRDQLRRVTDRGVECTPDLVVEIVSPSTAVRDRTVKRERYARLGVPEYWIVDAAARRVEVYRLREDPDHARLVADRLAWQPVQGGPVLELNVAELLADLE